MRSLQATFSFLTREEEKKRLMDGAVFRLVLAAAWLAISLALECYSGEVTMVHTMTCNSLSAQCFKSVSSNGRTSYGCANGCPVRRSGESCTTDGVGKTVCCCVRDLCNLATSHKQPAVLAVVCLIITSLLSST